MIDLKKLAALAAERNELFVNNRGEPVDFRSWPITHWACEFAGEAGELCNGIKKIERDGRTRELEFRLEQEFGDALISLCNLAREAGVDLEAATVLKFDMDSESSKLRTQFTKSAGEAVKD